MLISKIYLFLYITISIPYSYICMLFYYIQYIVYVINYILIPKESTKKEEIGNKEQMDKIENKEQNDNLTIPLITGV